MSENKMGVMPVPKLLMNMSLPMILSMLLQAMYNVVDSVFVGRIDQQSLTAVGLAFPAQNMMIAVASGLAVGVNALLSRALGAKRYDEVNRIAEHGIFLSLISYALFLLFGLFGARAFLAAQTDVPYIIDQGTIYLSTVCIYSFGMFGQTIFERLMQSTGRTMYTMITQGTGAIFNIIFDPIFIFTFKMGILGAALATVLGQIVAFLMAIYFNRRKNPEVQLDLRHFHPQRHTIGQICGIGIPSAIMIAIGSVMTFCMNKILIAYTTGKEVAATVFGVYFKLNSIFFMPVFGLNNGAVPIIAYNYGAQRKDRMLKTIHLTLLFGVLFMCIGTAVFFCVPGFLLRLFDADELMLSIGIPALRIIASSFLGAAVCISISSVYQALGKGVYSMIVSIIRQLGLLIPAAYILARLGQSTGNQDLVWLSFPLAEALAVLVTLFFYRRIRRRIIDPLPEVSAAKE